MEISPVTRVVVGTGSFDASSRPGAKVDFSDVRPPRAEQPHVVPGTLVGGTMECEFTRHSSGVQIVKFYDKRTGEVIDSMPSEKVLDAVTELITLVRKKA